LSHVKQNVIDIVNGKEPTEPVELVALQVNQAVVTLPAGMEPEDAAARLERYKQELAVGFKTIDEVRAAEGLPPVPDTTEAAVPLSLYVKKPFVRFGLVGDSHAIAPRGLPRIVNG
jgi:hypothetical protein